MTRYLAGIDIGGTHIKVMIVDQAYKPLGQAKHPTEPTSAAHLVQIIIDTVQRALAEAQGKPADLQGVGVGVPGQVDRRSGMVRHAVNLNIRQFALANALSERLGCPVKIDNDVTMAAVGAYQFLNPQSIKNFCYVNIGTGVSAGILLDGHVHRGQNDMAGEIGHMVIVDNGRICPCGNLGCLEAYVSGPAVGSAGQAALDRGIQSAMADYQQPLSASDVYQAAGAGDAAALTIVQEVGRYLGRALQNLMMAYDVGQIVLGGGVTRSGPRFLQPLLEEWHRQADRSPLAKMMLQPHVLSLAPADFNPGIWGAIVTAQNRSREEKISIKPSYN